MRYAADAATGSVSAAVTEVPPPRGALAMPAAEVDRLADEIAELSAHLDAATHRLLELIRRFDTGSGWYTQGCLSCAQWLSCRVGLDLCAAREKVRVARALGDLDRSTESGMIRIEAQLLPDEAALVLKAIETARQRAWKARRVSAESCGEGNGCREAVAAPARQSLLHRADALVQIAEDFLASSAAEANGPPVAIVVHVEADSLTDPASAEAGSLDDGTFLPRATIDRLACDASVLTVVEDARGTPLDVGRRRRTVPTALRRALQLRDKGTSRRGSRASSRRRATGGRHGGSRPAVPSQRGRLVS
jgi:hypothetical protein